MCFSDKINEEADELGPKLDETAEELPVEEEEEEVKVKVAASRWEEDFGKK